MKKTLSFILAAITAISMGTAVLAAENDTVTEEASALVCTAAEESVQSEPGVQSLLPEEAVQPEKSEIIEDEEVPAEPPAENENEAAGYAYDDELTEPETEEPVEEDPNEPVVTMFLCATARTFTGHVWLYFENICEKDIPIGYITLAPGETTSVGSLRNTRSDGGGTYYNGEAYMAKDIDKTGNHTTYLTMNLNRAQLETVNAQIKKRNSYNFLVWNCGNFAASVWNSVSAHRIVHICFPVFTIMQMKLHGGQKGFTMNRPTIDKCFKQIDGGVVPASEDSFNISCV